MARRLTPEERANWKERYFKKARIPNATRMAVARGYGCDPGETRGAWCVWCGAIGKVIWSKGAKGKPIERVTFLDLELDHVIAEVNGGGSYPENIVLACRKCNRARGHKGSYQPKMQYPARSFNG